MPPQQLSSPPPPDVPPPGETARRRDVSQAPGETARLLALLVQLDEAGPWDEIEAAHLRDARAWLASTADVYRRVKPATPPKHLVAYVVPADPETGDVLLVDHRNARLWLPPGGHVEPGEDPAAAAARELHEELGVSGAAAEPAFLTVTRTVGVDAGHTDVSLWYPARVPRTAKLAVDEGEFAAVRWWTRAELAAADPARFDPHLARYLAKAAAKSAA